MKSPVTFLIPLGVVVIVAVTLTAAMVPAEDAAGQMKLQEFGALPVVDRGRVKPFDTVARTSLMLISKRQSFYDEAGREQPPIKWLLDVMTTRMRSDSPALKYKVFRIENDQVLALIGLEPRPETHFRYALREFLNKTDTIAREATRARKVEEKQRSTFDVKVLELANQLQVYMELAELRSPLAVPPEPGSDEWEPLGQALAELRDNPKADPNALALGMMLLAYSHDNVEQFNRSLSHYQQRLHDQIASDTAKTGFEVFFNQAQPFYLCAVFYVAILFAAMLTWVIWIAFVGMGRQQWIEPLSWALIGATALILVVHTAALIGRMYLMDRWLVVVTNLYSSAIFIGWGCVLLGLILEMIFRKALNGLGLVVGCVCGAGAAFIAHHLASSGDTLEMMQAVLDTNFWLATHVTCVTFGYAATFVAGVVGILYVLCRVPIEIMSARLRPEQSRGLSILLRVLATILYGVVCFATFLSFTGTVLGGIWADQSWGRFWGWDPKENGALLIVLWNALLLHARWGGIVKQRGMAVLAIAGNMVTAWSWFGTNQLGVGLHAYGFNNTLSRGLVIFWFSMLFFIGIGLLPSGWLQSRTGSRRAIVLADAE